MLLIGSHALIHHLSKPLGRRPLDIDVIATFDELTSLTSQLKRETRVESIPLSVNKTVLKCADERIIEVELAWEGMAARSLLDRADRDPFPLEQIEMLPCKARIATLDELYTLKMSHRYLKDSPHFKKTRSDIMLMRGMGANVFDASWLKQREEETYWYKHPKLNVMKKDFFAGDGVEYVYDHDDIHRAMAHITRMPALGPSGYELTGPSTYGRFPIPAYTLYMKDGEEVKSDRSKFFSLPEKVRLYGVLEEAQVLALERSQVPFRGMVEPRHSFDIALRKVCTSITSGWFREFAWENFDSIEKLYEHDYVDHFWKAVDMGLVRKL